MADVTSEATLKVTTVGADKAAADLKKVQSGLKDVEGQARRTAGTLKAPVGGGGAASLAAGRAAHPAAARAGDLIGEAMGAMVKAIANPRARAAATKAGEAVTKQTIKQGEAHAKAVAGTTTKVNSSLTKTAGHVANLGKVFDPLVSLLPGAITGIAGAGAALGLLAPAAIAVAGSVLLLTKSFKWISDAAEDALDNLGRARRAAQGLNIGAEQERLSSAGTALGIAVGDKFVKPLEASINKLIGDLRTGDIDAKLQEKLNFFGVTLTRLKEFEDKTGRIDFQKVFALAVGLREELERNIQAAAGDPAKLAKLQENYAQFHKTFEQAFGKEFIDLVDRTSTNMVKAGQEWAAKLDAALGSMPREEVSKNAEEFQLAINRFGSVWTTLRTNIAEGAMPAATAAINAWANVFLEIAPKIQEIGKTLTIGLWQGVEATAGVLRDFVALLPSWETTLKTMQSLWTDFLAEGSRAWDAAENDWKIAVTVITGAISDLKRDFANMITEVKQTIVWIDGAITAFFAGLKDTIANFITGLTKAVPGSGINRNAPTLNPSDELPGLRRQSSFTNEGDTSISGARIQLAAMSGGSGGSDVNAVIDKALIKVDGNINAIVRNASLGGAGGAGDISSSNASFGGTGGFGGDAGGGVGGVGAGRDRGGFESNPAAGPRGGGGALAGNQQFALKTAMDQLRKEGVPEGSLRTAAAHLVAQAHAESGLDPTKTHDVDRRTGKPTGYGIYGARDPTPGRGRKTDMLAWLAANGYAQNSLEGQMRYMAHEAMSGKYPRTRNILMSGASGREDVRTLMNEFEAPANRTQDRSGMFFRAMRGDLSGDPNAGSAPAGPATPGAPTNSRLSAKQQVYGMERLDPRLHEIVAAATSHLPPGYRAEIVSAGRGGGAAGFHPKGKALDLRILDPNGNPIKHYGEDTTGLYTRTARAAYGEMLARYPGLKGKLAWGGAFGTKIGGGGPPDLMHFDVGGERGRNVRNRLSNLGALPGATFGGGKSAPIIVDQVSAQAPADDTKTKAFRSSAEGEAFGKSAAESMRKHLEGTNIPVSGVPPTSRGVAPHVGPKPVGADTATDI